MMKLSEIEDAERLATKDDIRELRDFILEREVTSLRWMVATFLGAQIAYFAITLTAVWFMMSRLH
jgi:hypothetical protein